MKKTYLTKTEAIEDGVSKPVFVPTAFPLSFMERAGYWRKGYWI